MSTLLSQAAVGRKTEDDATEILQAYISTTPAMVLNHTVSARPKGQPKGTGAGDHLITPE